MFPYRETEGKGAWERACPKTGDRFLLTGTQGEAGREDASLLPRQVGGGGAADGGDPPGGLQLPQTNALSGANRHLCGR